MIKLELCASNYNAPIVKAGLIMKRCSRTVSLILSILISARGHDPNLWATHPVNTTCQYAVDISNQNNK